MWGHLCCYSACLPSLYQVFGDDDDGAHMCMWFGFIVLGDHKSQLSGALRKECIKVYGRHHRGIPWAHIVIGLQYISTLARTWWWPFLYCTLYCIIWCYILLQLDWIPKSLWQYTNTSIFVYRIYFYSKYMFWSLNFQIQTKTKSNILYFQNMFLYCERYN